MFLSLHSMHQRIYLFRLYLIFPSISLGGQQFSCLIHVNKKSHHWLLAYFCCTVLWFVPAEFQTLSFVYVIILTLTWTMKHKATKTACTNKNVNLSKKKDNIKHNIFYTAVPLGTDWLADWKVAWISLGISGLMGPGCVEFGVLGISNTGLR